jgi:phosphohistidine phosphatase
VKRLFLLRHAKAASDRSVGEDALRPLTARGREDAAALARHLAAKKYRPDSVLCSPALRTRQTCEIVQPGAAVAFPSELYLASCETILAHIRSAGGDALMIVGHNPGLEQCAGFLARRHPDGPAHRHLQAIGEKFPTCALAVLEFDVGQWSAIDEGEGELTAFVSPKSL